MLKFFPKVFLNFMPISLTKINLVSILEINKTLFILKRFKILTKSILNIQKPSFKC